MNQDKIKTIVGIVGALFGIYNLAASHFGWACITFDSAGVTAAITTLWTLAFTCYSTWKNCNVTPIAKELQAFKNAVSNKDIEGMQKAIDTFKSIKNAVEAEE